ncbi:MAG: transcriptional regulator GcvA [Pseudomonadota bacterium]
MADRLPSLTALRAFEAAARHLSFAKAAEELAVTPAALSFQIKQLEEALGAPLFTRLTRQVALTEAGKALAPGASAGFDALRAAWRAAGRVGGTDRLTVTAGPAFTAKWLAPSLSRFASAHPTIELRFVATLAMLDFARDGIDLAVRFGEGDDAGYFSEPLLTERVFPAMRPEIAARVKTPADLLNETLISEESIAFLRPAPSWEVWLRAAGVSQVPAPALSFSQADHAIDAALEGVGVTLGRLSLATHALQTGALVAPFPLVLSVKAQYRVVCPRGEEVRPAVAAFRAFLKAQADVDPLGPDRTVVPLAALG